VATSAKVVETTGRVTRRSFSNLDRLARALKQGGRNQVAVGAPGGGKNAAHMDLDHLINFVLGLAADPITEAPEQVEQFANMQWHMNAPRREWSPVSKALSAWSEAIGSERLMPDGTLGEALARLVDWLSRPEGKELRSVLGQRRGLMYLDLVTQDGYEPSAIIGIFENQNNEVNGESFAATYEVGPRPHFDYVLNADETRVESVTVSPPPGEQLPPGTIRKTVRIPYAVFEAMADLWADTRARQTNPQTKNAGLPARRTGARA
jgi:hypothetical protein